MVPGVSINVSNQYMANEFFTTIRFPFSPFNLDFHVINANQLQI